MKDLKLMYKSDTGESAILNIESSHLTKSLEGIDFEGMSGLEMRDALNYDFKKNAKWGVFIESIPKDFVLNDDLNIVTPEYVKWLEDKLNSLI